MRHITTHVVNGLNEAILIEVLDDPGEGGANHEYVCSYVQQDPHDATNTVTHHCGIKFQEGPITEAGVNGISNEALLAIVRDRLECFQAGPFACEENAEALMYVCEAMHNLQQRTIDRTKRGVEGTTQP